jgi:uncharacterized protein (DUF2141 family)
MKNSVQSTIVAATFATLLSAPMTAADLVINIGPVEKAAGQLMVAIYDSKESFRETTSHAASLPAETGEMQFTFANLEAGDYAVLVYHDVNNNGNLDTNMLGMPKEPWGASLEGKMLFGAPDWAKTRFTVSDDGKTIKVFLN